MISVEAIGGVRKFRMARSILGRAVYYTAAYWVNGMMVDTGCSYTVHELVSAVEELDLDLVVNTHSHEDHIGANEMLSKKRGVRIFAHDSALPVLASGRKQKTLKPYQVLMWGYPEPSQAAPIPEILETKHHRFKVIHTPGHSPDHICLYEPAEGWLFCGDAYIGGRDRALRADYNIWQIIASLKEIAALDIGLLFTGSGNVRENARSLLLEKIRYLESSGEQALELSRQGLNHGQIRRKMFGQEPLIAYITLGHFSGRNLVRSFVQDFPPAGTWILRVCHDPARADLAGVAYSNRDFANAMAKQNGQVVVVVPNGDAYWIKSMVPVEVVDWGIAGPGRRKWKRTGF